MEKRSFYLSMKLKESTCPCTMNSQSLKFGLKCKTTSISCCTFLKNRPKTAFQNAIIFSTSWTLLWKNTLRQLCAMQTSREQQAKLKQKQMRPSKSAKNGGTNFKQFLSNLVSLILLITFFSSQGPHYSPFETKFKNGSAIKKEKKNWHRGFFRLV